MSQKQGDAVEADRGPPVKHPWHEWLRRPVATLVQGVDYTGRTDTMAQQVRNAAWRLGYRVKVEILPDLSGVVVRVTGRREQRRLL